ncbi:MAG: hypothetical protein ACI892_002227, partial [Marinobacter maritimus]
MKALFDTTIEYNLLSELDLVCHKKSISRFVGSSIGLST